MYVLTSRRLKILSFCLFLVGLANVMMMILLMIQPISRDIFETLRRIAKGSVNNVAKSNAVPKEQQLMMRQRTVSETGRPLPNKNESNHEHLWNSSDMCSALCGDKATLKFLPRNYYHSLIKTHDGRIGCDDSVRVVALIASPNSNGELRKAIRKTWGNMRQYGGHSRRLQVVFVTGKPDCEGGTNVITPILEEGEDHGDILVGDFVYNDRMRLKTTLPLLLGAKWTLAMCRSVEYLYFGYDNTVLNGSKLLEKLNERHITPNFPHWMGKITPYSAVVRDNSSIYYVSLDVYTGESYPPFCTDERGYVITRSAARELIDLAPDYPVICMADVFVAIIAMKQRWTLVDDVSFSELSFSPSNICTGNMDALTMRGTSELDKLVTAWTNRDNVTWLRTHCKDPSIDIVLPSNVDNRQYLKTVLAYRLNHPHVCSDDAGDPLDIFMIVLISTPPDDSEMRKAIRETWCLRKKVRGETIRCLFIMGQNRYETHEHRKRLLQEDAVYGDIIQASFDESFQNLTLKVILGLKWITDYCQHAKYFYKGYEDMFVNFYNIITYIKTLRALGMAKARFFIGSRVYGSIRLSPNVEAHRELKRYHVPDDMYFGSYYPPYCSGGGYVLSTESVPQMYQESLTTSLINIDDAFQGILTKKVGFGPKGHAGFKSWGGKNDTCSLRDKNTMTVHGISKNAQNLYDVWRTYLNTTNNCTHISKE